jgi:polyhydroxybutyrate depolymerase
LTSRDTPPPPDPETKLSVSHWQIDGVQREALIHLPFRTVHPAPIIFVFPEHGQSMELAAGKYKFEKFWPKAIVVYMQGLAPDGKEDSERKNSGWQQGVEELGDRDLKFFDAALKTFKNLELVDTARIYATGHGEGGRFVYCLMAARPQIFAAIAPSSCTLPKNLMGARQLPVLHLTGKSDENYEAQKTTIESLRKLEQCEGEKPYRMDNDSGLTGTVYDSKIGSPVTWLVHEDKRPFPGSVTDKIVNYFRVQAQPNAGIINEVLDDDDDGYFADDPFSDQATHE